MSPPATGAQALLRAAHELGIRVCFANPGTTELGLVRALDDVPGIRPVLGLFEGVCTGAADGFARVTGRPALTLLHLGPGLANGLANLHNARRAHSPIINIVGDHATWHLPFDAPLTSDIESLAKPVSGTVIRLNSSASVGDSVRQAMTATTTSPGCVVTLIAPSDLMDERVSEIRSLTPVATHLRKGQRVPSGRILEVAERLSARDSWILLLGSDLLSEDGQRAAARIARVTGARLIMESYPSIVELGGDLPRLERLAYFPDDVARQLGSGSVLLAGARAPVSYFGYEGQPSNLVPGDRLVEISTPGEDGVLALEQLAERLRGPEDRSRAPPPAMPPKHDDTRGLYPETIAEELVRQIPEGAIVSLEGSTCGGPYLQLAHGARRHRVMTNTGGAIGQGLPCAVGAAVAEPEARVICLQSDGSAQYTLQALWTMAREALNVTVIIAANHRYGILQTELRRAGAALERAALERLTNLDSPRIDWLALARGYGVPGSRANTAEGFHKAMTTGLQTAGPYLIEAQLA